MRDAKNVIAVPRTDVAAAVGEVVSLVKHGGAGVVVKATDETLLVDFNHPLAGQPMNVTITLLAVEELSPFGPELRVVRLRAGDAKTYPIFGDWVTLHLEIYHDGKLLSSTRETGTPLRDLEQPAASMWCILGGGLELQGLRL